MNYFDWRGEKIPHFVLGAAQLGMNYGIANKIGQPNQEEAFSILDEAAKNGVTMIDTAQAYGNSESVIGQWIKANNNNCPFNIISKWHSDVDINDEVQLKLSVRASVQILGGPLWGMMIHDEKWLDQFDIIAQVAKDLKKEGVLKYLGASVYSVEAAKKALLMDGIDFIQVPCNIWSQNVMQDGVISMTKKLNKLCFVRSVFLQGLLLMDESEIEMRLPHAKKAGVEWNRISKELGISKEKLSLQFGLSLNCPLVIGVYSSEQLSKNMEFLETSPLDGHLIKEIRVRMQPLLDEKITSPQTWGGHF